MKNYLMILFFVFSFVIVQLDADVERRAAIDVGSGGTKVAVADVDTETNQILNIILDTSFPVAYQAALDRSENGTFDPETEALGLKTFREIKEITDELQVQKVVAVATSAFRKANNGKEFAAEVAQQTGIEVHIIPQREEGEVAFFSALASGLFQPQDIVVLDIGTGSLQMSTLDSTRDLIVYMGEEMGSVAFKNYVISIIQEKDELSPNPMSEEDLKKADSYVRYFARKAYPVLKQKIQDNVAVVGIGRLFYNSLRPIASEDGVITRDGLRAFIRNALNKSDAEINDPFAHVDVTNSILTLAIMKALHIQEIYPVETTSTKGLLVNPAYWN